MFCHTLFHIIMLCGYVERGIFEPETRAHANGELLIKMSNI